MGIPSLHGISSIGVGTAAWTAWSSSVGSGPSNPGSLAGLAGLGVSLNIPRVNVPTLTRTTTTTTTVTFETYSSPWMRNRLIYFHAEGLLPNTKYTPYFDGVDVSQWCREEGSFVEFADTTNDDQDLRPDLTEHPSTKGDLISDTNGEIIGSFWLPNTGVRDEFQSADDAAAALEAWLSRKNALIGSLSVASTDPTLFDEIGWKFEVGQKIFELNTNRLDYFLGNFYSWSRTPYTASGQVSLRQTTNTTVTTVSRQQPAASPAAANRRFWDPLAQTFFVEETKSPGIFLTGIDIYVRSAPEATDAQIPLEIQIRGTRDGTPLSEKISEGASVFKTAGDVRTAISGQDNTSRASVLAHPVHFDFDEPIFLKSGEQYAFVVKSDTPLYEVFYATTTLFELGSTTKRIFKQNSAGSMFTSQNASTWTPDQNSDIAFQLYTARFKTAGTVKLKNVPAPRTYLDNEDCFSIDSASNKLFVTHPVSGLQPGDRPRLIGLDSATTYGGVLGSTIMKPTNVIDSADVTGYTILLDSSATSNAIFGNSSITAQQNFMIDEYYPLIDVTVFEQTAVDNTARFTSGISYANDIRLTNLDTRFDLDNNYRSIDLNASNLFTSPRMVANDSAETNDMSGASSVLIDMALSSTNVSDDPSGSYTSNVSPVIDLERMTLIGYNNIIDNQDSVAAANPYTNRPTNFVPETKALSGTSLSKHITKPISLTNDAVGLKILMSVHRPPAANLVVYYRTGPEDVNLYDVAWTELDAIVEDPTKFGTEGALSRNGYPEPNPIPTKRENTFYSEYEYFAGDQYGLGLTDLPAFSQYQIKVVLKTTNTSQIPIIDNLRVIAVAV